MKNNNALLEKNLRILQVYQPKLAERLWKRLDEITDVSSLITYREIGKGKRVFGADTLPFFQNNEHPLPELDFSKTKSSQEPRCVFFIYGIGAPPYLFHVFRKLPKNTLAVVVIEPSLDLILHTLSLTSVYTALPQGCRISFFAFPEQTLGQEALGVNIRKMGIFLANTAITVRHAGEMESSGDLLKGLERELWRLIRLSVEFLGNTAEDTLIGVRNFALNMPWLLNSPSFADFSRLHGRPCISVASGPSLEKNVHLLKDIQDRFIIISADTAAKKLLSLGIFPHFITCIERPQNMYEEVIQPLLRDFKEECRNIVLVAAFVCTPQIVARWPGPLKIVGKSELSLDNWLVKGLTAGDLLFCGASVAHMAFSLSRELRASAIALIGQDLAYGEEGRSHASGTASDADMAVEEGRKSNLLEVPGVFGGTVQTHTVWYSMLKIFESVIEETDTVVYDCTQGGALIKGTEVQDLADFIAERDTDSLGVFPASPDKMAREAIENKDVALISQTILQDFGEKSQWVIDASLDILKEIETHVTSVSETLLPKQRREHARKASLLLDLLHKENDPLAFIGQSYTNLSGKVLAESRYLDSMEHVYAWKRAFSEIIEGHRIILKFFSQWFSYVSKAILWYGKDPVHKEELTRIWTEEDLVQDIMDFLENLHSLLDKSGVAYSSELENHDEGSQLVWLNLFLARIDEQIFPREKGELLWQMALFLETQGRGERACRMAIAARFAFEGCSMSEEQIIAFTQDYARILAKPDLTHVPLFRESFAAARNLLRYNREDLFEKLEENIKGEWRGYLENVRDSRMFLGWNKIEQFHLLADICLTGNDFGGALLHIWDLVQWAFVEKDPRGKRYIQWLCNHLEIALKAQEERDRSAGETVVQALVDFPELLAFYSPLFSYSLLDIFRQRGLNLSGETVEKEIQEV